MHFEPKESGIRLEALRSALIARYDDEDLHQLRVTLRRTRSVLRNSHRKDARNLRRKLGDLAQCTNDARDWDTLVARARAQLPAEQLTTLLPVLRTRQEAAHEQVYCMLNSPQWFTTIALLKAYLEEAPFEEHHRATGPRQLAKRHKRAIAAGYKAIRKDDDRCWHKLRIAVKDLRYTLESLGRGFTRKKKRAELLDLCKSTQTQLGEWHDTVVHRQLLEQLAETGAPGGPGLEGKALDLMREALAVEGRLSLERVKHNFEELEHTSVRSIHRKGVHTGDC